MPSSVGPSVSLSGDFRIGGWGILGDLGGMVDLPNTMVNLSDTLVDLSDTLVDLPTTTVHLHHCFGSDSLMEAELDW